MDNKPRAVKVVLGYRVRFHTPEKDVHGQPLVDAPYCYVCFIQHVELEDGDTVHTITPDSVRPHDNKCVHCNQELS